MFDPYGHMRSLAPPPTQHTGVRPPQDYALQPRRPLCLRRAGLPRARVLYHLRQFWTILSNFGPLYAISDHVGQFCTILGNFAFSWTLNCQSHVFCRSLAMSIYFVIGTFKHDACASQRANLGGRGLLGAFRIAGSGSWVGLFSLEKSLLKHRR